MAVSDFMSQDLITLTPDAKINRALDLMKSRKINQIPVLEGQQLKGLITRRDIAAAMPSPATSLSVYEVNYLISKATVSDIMQTSVPTIAPQAQLEAAIKMMREQNVSVVVVSDQDQVKGIITKNDIFDAFLQIAGYDLADSTFLRIKVVKDEKGIIGKLGEVLAQNDFFILNLVVVRHDQERILELHLKGTQTSQLNEALAAANFQVEELRRNE